LNWLLALGVGFATAQLALYATTVYLHRGLAHSALTLHPVAAFALRVVLWITTGIRPRDWIGVHRSHHASVDTADDPHSPRTRGFWPVQLANIVMYHRAVRDRARVARYTHDLEDNWLDRYVFDRETLGPLIGVGLLCLVLGWQTGLVAAAVHLVFYVGLNGSVNAIGHTSGRRPAKTTFATNGVMLSLLTAGEGMHNNHHAVPTSARLAWRPFEVDPGWWLIRSLHATGLAKLRHPGGMLAAAG